MQLPRLRAHGRALALLSILLAGSTLSGRASAHFVLVSPDASRSQTALGDPQKLGPCGDEVDRTATATGSVTTVRAGETLTIRLKETVFHPGHYRVALASDRSTLPAEPKVTAGATPCGSVPIMKPAQFPVLADGALVHTAALKGEQTIEVTLPADLTCERCTLQVIEFMSDHGLNNPGGCFYHHCAELKIAPAASDPGRDAGSVDAGSDAGVAPRDGGSSAADAGTKPRDDDAAGLDAGRASDGEDEESGGCSLGGRRNAWQAALACLLALGLGRRRTPRRKQTRA